MKQLFLFLNIAVVTFFSSCSKEIIRGSGSIGNKAINVSAFTAVETHSDIKAAISYGTSQEVTATGYDNLLNILDFKVENAVLKLNFNSTYNTIRNGNVIATIKVPILSGVTIHGSKNIEVSGFANGDTFDAKIHGSGSIRVNNSSYKSALLGVNGSGNIEAEGLQTKQSEVNINGSGNAGIFVTERLKASVFGSGNIYYWGNPALEIVRNGSGKVIKRY
jgi:Putative auto-transporter adhesin, head GIN domain